MSRLAASIVDSEESFVLSCAMFRINAHPGSSSEHLSIGSSISAGMSIGRYRRMRETTVLEFGDRQQGAALETITRMPYVGNMTEFTPK